MTPEAAAAGRVVGISLIELVVVAAIGALLLALSVNGWGLLAGHRLTGAARVLAGDIRMVEQRARSERTCYRLVFDPVGEAYRIDRQAAAGGASPSGDGSCAGSVTGAWITGLFAAGPAGPYSRRLPAGVDLVSTSFGGDTLLFGPMGNPNAGRARLRTAGGRTRDVVVDVMGRVRVVR